MEPMGGSVGSWLLCVIHIVGCVCGWFASQAFLDERKRPDFVFGRFRIAVVCARDFDEMPLIIPS